MTMGVRKKFFGSLAGFSRSTCGMPCATTTIGMKAVQRVLKTITNGCGGRGDRCTRRAHATLRLSQGGVRGAVFE